MRRLSVFILTFLVCLAAVQPSELAAADGAIPIWEPTTISEAGRYILVRNIGDFQTDNPITIESDDVELDLNGHTVTGGTGAIFALGVSGINVHDGFLRTDVDGLRLLSVAEFAVRRVTITSGDDGPIFVSGSNGVVEDNQIDGEIATVNGASISVLNNESSAGLFTDCVNCRVSGNAFAYVSLDGTGGRIQDNTMAHIVVNGSDNVLRNNTMTSASQNGISVFGSRNHLADNVVTSSAGFGLDFSALSSDNVYRGNTARGNGGTGCSGTSSGGDFCDEGTNNTSHGDNYMPGQM
jgi:parallel beta-helix repeat protein